MHRQIDLDQQPAAPVFSTVTTSGRASMTSMAVTKSEVSTTKLSIVLARGCHAQPPPGAPVQETMCVNTNLLVLPSRDCSLPMSSGILSLPKRRRTLRAFSGSRPAVGSSTINTRGTLRKLSEECSFTHPIAQMSNLASHRSPN